MTEDASAGRLYADVVADTSGFRKDAERKLKTALAGLKVKAKVEVEYSRTQARAALNATLREVTRDEKLKAVKAPVTFDPKQVRRELQRALREAAKLENPPTVKVKVEVDDAQARRQLDRLSRSKHVTVDTRANTKGAEDDIEGARRRAKRNPIDLNVRVPTSALSRVGKALTSLTQFPAIASGIAVAAGAAVNLASGLFAVTAAASQAVGVLAAIPNAIGVAAQGIGALVLGFSGIGDAVKAMTKAQTAAGPAATKSAAQQNAAAQVVRDAQERVARAQEAAAERVAEARRNLARVQVAAAEQNAEAERRVADVQAEGARRIIDSQQQVADAHAAVQRAVEDLADATEQATERAQDLALQLSGAALDEEGAVLAVERAKKRLEEILQPGSTADSLDRREADLAFRQALQRLAEIRESNEDLAKEKQELDRTGISGSQEVVSAQERVTEAVRAEQEARQGLARTQAEVARNIADAQYELAKTQRDNAREVADAQRDLVKAQRDSAREIADAQKAVARAMASTASAAAPANAAMTALNAAMANLSPQGQKFARFLDSTLMPRFKKLKFAVQDALLPPLKTAITKAMPLLDVLEKGLVGSSKVIGGLAIDLAKLISGPAFKKDVGTIMSSNNRAMKDFGKAGIALVDILRKIAVVAGPVLLEPFAKWVRTLAEGANASNALTRSRITDFLKRAAKTAKTLGKIVGNVVAAIYNLGRAARPTGDTLLGDLADASERLRKWTEDPKNQQRIRDFFENTVPVMRQFGNLFNRIVELFTRLGEITGGGTLDGLFWVLNRILDVLQGITSLPGGGAILTALLTLSGVGLGLGLVAKGLGGIVTNIARLAKFTGVTKMLGALTKFGKDGIGKDGAGKGKGPLGKLADEADDMGEAIDRELPKDKKKSAAVKDIGDKAHATSGKAKDLGGKVDGLGTSAAASAKKSKKLSGALGKVGAAASTALGKVNGLIGIGGGGEGKTGAKGGKLKTAAKGAGGLLALTGLLFGEDIANAVSGGETGTPRAVAGSALSSGLTGGGIGSFLGGPIGGLIAGLFSAGFGAVDEGGGNVKAAGVGALAGLPGLLLAGFGNKIPDLAKKVRPELDKLSSAFKTFSDNAPLLLNAGWKNVLTGVTGFLGQMPGKVKGFLGQVGAKFTELKNDAPALLRTGWQTVVNTVPGLRPLVDKVGEVASGARQKFADLKTNATTLLRTGWTSALNTIPGLRPLVDRVGEIASSSQKKFTDLKANAPTILRAGWQNVLGTIPTLKPLTAKVGEVADGVVKWFKTAVAGVKTNWDRLPSVMGAPIKTVANTVYNNGIVRVWNAVATKIPGFGTLAPISLGFARGGILPGTSSYRDGDDQLVPMRKGEGVYVSEAMADPYERARLHAVNAAAMRGQSLQQFQGFAKGGIFDGVGTFLTAAKDAFTGGLKKALSGALDPILSGVSSSLGGSPYGQMIAGGARLLASKVVDRIMGFEDQLVGGDATGVAKAAAKYIGQGDDRGPNNNWLTRKWGMPGAPWCAMFVSQAIEDAKATKKYAGWPTAAVYGYYSRMKKVPGDTARAGDLGVYGGNSGHINVIEKNLGQGNFQTIGGNENSVVRRGHRVGAYAILRPEGKAMGGVVDQRAFREKNLGFDHDQRDPLFRLLARLSPSVAMNVSNALAASDWVQRDSGGPLYPGTTAVVNNTGGLEWVLTPQAVRLLGGPQAVQALNDRARVSAAGRAGRATAMATTGHPGAGAAVTQNIYPQKGQSEHEIAMIAIRKIGAVLGH